jgi:cytochrome oxidase Cu insertion factor (SCO1/SenC/PrrC family)
MISEGILDVLRQPTAQEVAGPAEPGYNYQHVSLGVFAADMKQTMTGGPEQGAPAPDFELSTTAEEPVRLSALRGTPVVLIFGSVT